MQPAASAPPVKTQRIPFLSQASRKVLEKLEKKGIDAEETEVQACIARLASAGTGFQRQGEFILLLAAVPASTSAEKPADKQKLHTSKVKSSDAQPAKASARPSAGHQPPAATSAPSKRKLNHDAAPAPDAPGQPSTSAGTKKHHRAAANADVGQASGQGDQLPAVSKGRTGRARQHREPEPALPDATEPTPERSACQKCKLHGISSNRVVVLMPTFAYCVAVLQQRTMLVLFMVV